MNISFMPDMLSQGFLKSWEFAPRGAADAWGARGLCRAAENPTQSFCHSPAGLRPLWGRNLSLLKAIPSPLQSHELHHPSCWYAHAGAAAGTAQMLAFLLAHRKHQETLGGPKPTSVSTVRKRRLRACWAQENSNEELVGTSPTQGIGHARG